jgi:hypothetical protein
LFEVDAPGVAIFEFECYASASSCARATELSRQITVLAALLQVVHELAQRHDGLTRRVVTASEHRWRKPAFPDRFSQQRIGKKWAATRLRRYNFRYHAITVRDQNGFATSSEADIFAKLVFEDLQTD